MKSNLLCGALQLSLSLSLVGCGQDSPPKPFKARILSSEAGVYSLKTVVMPTLTSADAVQGELAELRGNAVIDSTVEIQEIINPTSRDSIFTLPGRAVQLDYSVTDGVIYPSNFDSMAMLAVYSNYERVFTFWKANFGLDVSDFGRLRLFFAPRISAGGDGLTAEVTLKLNAAFLPGNRDFLLFKTSRLEKVPVMMNLAIVAHEFGHAVFDDRFAKKDAEFYLTSNEHAEEQLSGINEGVADFFAAMVVGNNLTEFKASIEELGEQRILPVGWTMSTLETSKCQGSFYCKGSVLASSLYEIATTGGQDTLQVGKVLYEALDGFRAHWVAQKNSQDFDYHFLLSEIVKAAPAEERTVYCNSFRKWFDVAHVREKIGC